MKKIIVATIAVAAFAGSAAYAADIPKPVFKAPVAAPGFSWGGFYGGVNVGRSIGRDPTRQTDTENLAPGIFFNDQFSIVPRGGVFGA